MKHEVIIKVSAFIEAENAEHAQELMQDGFEFSIPSDATVHDVDVQVVAHQEDGWDGEEDDGVEEISFDELRHSPVD